MTKLKKVENKFTTEITPWLLKNFFPKQKKACGIEYKSEAGGTFNIKQWKKKEPQQSIKLNDCTTEKGAYFKIPDLSGDITRDFDAYYICNGSGFLIIWFDKYEVFFVLPIQEVNNMGVSASYKKLLEDYSSYKLIKKEKKEHATF